MFFYSRVICLCSQAGCWFWAVYAKIQSTSWAQTTENTGINTYLDIYLKKKKKKNHTITTKAGISKIGNYSNLKLKQWVIG